MLSVWKSEVEQTVGTLCITDKDIVTEHTTGLSSSSIISWACLSLISTTLAGKSASIKMCSGSL